MDILAEIVKVLENHFDVNGWPLHVSKEKLLNRCQIASDEALHGWDIVEIERHRPILGTAYVKGLGMDAFETYYMRYAVHVPSSVVGELPDRPGELAIDIDGIVESELDASAFDLSIEPIDDNSYTFREGVSHDETVVTSLEEAREFALSFLDGFVDNFSGTLNRELTNKCQIENIQKEKLLSGYEECMKAALSEKGELAWRGRES